MICILLIANKIGEGGGLIDSVQSQRDLLRAFEKTSSGKRSGEQGKRNDGIFRYLHRSRKR